MQPRQKPKASANGQLHIGMPVVRGPPPYTPFLRRGQGPQTQAQWKGVEGWKNKRKSTYLTKNFAKILPRRLSARGAPKIAKNWKFLK